MTVIQDTNLEIGQGEKIPAPIRKRRKGFSLVELMVSMGIMSTVLCLILGVFTNVANASRKAVDLTAGTIVAESVLNSFVYDMLTNDAATALFFSKDYNSTPYMMGTQMLNDTTFTYKVYGTTVNFPTAGITSTNNGLKRVDIVVWWWQEDEGDGSSAGSTRNTQSGMGLLRTELSRLVNQNSDF